VQINRTDIEKLYKFAQATISLPEEDVRRRLNIIISRLLDMLEFDDPYETNPIKPEDLVDMHLWKNFNRKPKLEIDDDVCL